MISDVGTGVNWTPVLAHCESGTCFSAFAFQNMLKALSATQKQVDLVKLHEQAKRNLEEEIQNYKDEAQKQRKIIFQLEKERDRYINEASDLTQKVGPLHGLWREGLFGCLPMVCLQM